MRIFHGKTAPAVISLSLAALVALSAAGCGKGNTQNEEKPQTVSPSVTETARDSSSELTTSSTADTAAAASTGAFPAAPVAAGTPAAASAGATSEEGEAASTGAGIAAPIPAGSAGTYTDDSAEEGSTMDETEFALDGGTDVHYYYADDDEDDYDREEPDTALQESVLYGALEDCTGWGQSAGSSLRAAGAATSLLRWANQANAGSADPALLAETVKTEFRRFSHSERSTIRSNWSAVSYDADMILDDYDAVRYLLEDAGCSELAKDAAEAENALQNWKAAEEALEAALKK